MRPWLVLLVSLILVSCAAKDSQNRYRQSDVGKDTTVEFGTIIAMRDIEITGTNTGTGALAGAAAGIAIGASTGKGTGKLAATMLGAVIGGLAGHAAEDAIQDDQGIEYTITKENGQTVTFAQNIAPDDAPLQVGDRVMVQKGTRDGAKYVRVLSADHIPQTVKRPQDIQIQE